MSQHSDNSIKNLCSKIEPIKFCMMTTLNDDMSLSSRPMTYQAIDDDGTMWFFTSDDHQLAQDLIRHPQINVSFANPSDSVYVAVSGSVTLVKDKAKASQLWNPMVAAWFPLGIDDPHLSLIKFSIHYAEYWDSDTNKMLQLFAMAKAVLTGHRPKEIGEHEKMQF